MIVLLFPGAADSVARAGQASRRRRLGSTGNLRRGIKVLLTSGYTDADPEKTGIDRAGINLLKKQYRNAELATVIRTAMGG